MDSIQKEIWDHGGDLRPGTPWWSPRSPSTTPSSRPWLMLILVQAKRNRVVSKHGRLNTYRTDDAEEKHRLCDTISGNKNTLWTFYGHFNDKKGPNVSPIFELICWNWISDKPQSFLWSGFRGEKSSLGRWFISTLTFSSFRQKPMMMMILFCVYLFFTPPW